MDPCFQSLHDSKLPFQLLHTEKFSSAPPGKELPVFYFFPLPPSLFYCSRWLCLGKKAAPFLNWPSSDFLTTPIPRRAASLLGRNTLLRWMYRITCMI